MTEQEWKESLTIKGKTTVKWILKNKVKNICICIYM